MIFLRTARMIPNLTRRDSKILCGDPAWETGPSFPFVVLPRAVTIEPMRTGLIIGTLLSVVCSSLFAETKEPVYLGIDAKGVRHESKESAGDAPWMRDLKHARMPRPLRGDRGWRWAQGVGIFRIRIEPATGAAKEVTIVRSTGHVAFDRSALLALKVWRWKSGTWTQVDVPIFFQRGGGVLLFPRYTILPVRR